MAPRTKDRILSSPRIGASRQDRAIPLLGARQGELCPPEACSPAREATGRPAKERTRTTAMGVAGRVPSERPPQWGEGSLGRDLAGEEELAGTFFPRSGFPAGLKASSEAGGASLVWW